MKSVEKPPNLLDLLKTIMNKNRLPTIMSTVLESTANGKYLHWQDVKHRQPPCDLTAEEWWAAIKMHRQGGKKQIPLQDMREHAFWYVLADPIPERLHEIDKSTAGQIRMPEQITNPATKDQYIIGSLIEEAITSSQLEGAATTRPVAKEMIRTNREPQDTSECMILNNYRTMRKISKWKTMPLTKELMFDLHRSITKKTLDDHTAAGRFRRPDESIVIGTQLSDQILHNPPPADQLDERCNKMCDFANGKAPEAFVHPVLRSIILHFWLAYDHPFVDGNGRTARALFYWSMLRNGYWLSEYISISSVIRKAHKKYSRSFLLTESDDNDLTYFIVEQLRFIQLAVNELHKYISRKTSQLQQIESELRGMLYFNHRQRALLSHALRHPNAQYTIESHKQMHNVSYQTARMDLLELAEKDLLKKIKIKKKFYFEAVTKLERKLVNQPKSDG